MLAHLNSKNVRTGRWYNLVYITLVIICEVFKFQSNINDFSLIELHQAELFAFLRHATKLHCYCKDSTGPCKFKAAESLIYLYKQGTSWNVCFLITEIHRLLRVQNRILPFVSSNLYYCFFYGYGSYTTIYCTSYRALRYTYAVQR